MVHDPHRTGARPSGQARTPEPKAAPEAGGDRVAKMLARAGVASRREVERLIEAGRVALNGAVLTTPAVKVEPGDILTTGTPPGVGEGQKPEKIFLKAGDVMKLGIDKLGEQQQTVIAWTKEGV